MSASLRVGTCFAVFLFSMGTEVLACDVSGWLVSDNEGPCLEPTNQGEDTYRVENACDEPIALTEADCSDDCAPILEWFVATRTFKATHGGGEGTTGVHETFARRSMENLGAWIMGRNMFGPIRGDWPDDAWKGWWGANPPYHVPVFILTHHPRKSIEMEGGTTFHFVTEGMEVALNRAKQAAGEKDIRIGGGAATIRQYLRAGLIEEMHVAISPIVLGSGEHLFSGIDLVALGYRVTEHAESEGAMHVVLTRAR